MKTKVLFTVAMVALCSFIIAFQIDDSAKQVTDGSISTILAEHIGEMIEVGHPTSGFATVKLTAVYKDCYKISDEDNKFNILPFSDLIKISFHRNGNFMIVTSHGNMGEIRY